jgi:hypothetical protein
MLIVLPLLSALSAVPAIANSYSNSEKRTLQAAVSSVLHAAELSNYYQQCKEQPHSDDTDSVISDRARPRLLSLLQQKVNTQNTELLLAADAGLTQKIRSYIVKPVNCEDSKGLQSLLDNYEVALFTLELALPLEKALGQKTAANKSRPNAEQNEVSQLIARSHAIALVNVVDKQQLNAVQQANYLHPDYSGKYIFKVQHGWRSNVTQYLGMHIFVADSDIDKTSKQWLVFLDKNGHFIKAIEAYKATAHIKALQQAQWRYDVHGNLHRN